MREVMEVRSRVGKHIKKTCDSCSQSTSTIFVFFVSTLVGAFVWVQWVSYTVSVLQFDFNLVEFMFDLQFNFYIFLNTYMKTTLTFSQTQRETRENCMGIQFSTE
jgi:uncharacterized membrane protein (UPF0182 family)